MLDPDIPTGSTEESTTQAAEPAPRRRRAASRPAGPPRALEPTPPPPALEAAPGSPELEPPAETPEAVEVEWGEVMTDAPEVAALVEEELQPAGPAPAEPSVEEATASPEGEEQTIGDESPQGDEADAPGQPVEPASGQPGPDEAEPAAGEAPAGEAVEEAPRAAGRRRRAPASPEAEAAPRRRRRPVREEQPAAADDELAESLAQLGEEREQAVAGSDAPAGVDVSAALDDLAAAIGGRDEDADEESGPEAGDEGDAGDGETPRRRRRRRGGRRRRRGADGAEPGAEDEAGDDEAGAEPEDGEGEPAEESDAVEGEESEGDEAAGTGAPGRRRRRRRRRGEETGAADEEGVDVVVKVREPRRTRSVTDEITGIEGSTRMEAKRQRRREGRAAGRRRAPVLSESEFLARRESVDRMMLIRQADDYTQIAVLEDGILVEHYVDRDSSASMIGNIYLGRVQNVLPSMEAAFVDIGRGRNAVIYAGEVDWDSFGVTGDDRRVEKVLKSGQSVLVQVTKDPIGAKGARLTAHLSIPGRYVVYCPGGQLSGISRKLPEGERQRLKGILDEAVGSDASVIVRTAAEGASEEELLRDVTRLKAQWEVISKRVKTGSSPQLLYAEPDLTVRIVRDLFTEDFSTLVVDGNGRGEDAFDTVQAYVSHVAPHLQERLRHWDRAGEGDLFDRFRVHEQVSKALERKVNLPSGGSLIIDRTEAMTVVDVNTGKFTGTQGNLEATVTSNNLEAAEEIVRQLRLRDIGGIIIIDFIDMVLPANRELLLRRLVECLGRDRTRHQVAEVTSLGLVQMTRKRIGTGLAEAFTVVCDTCKGRGYHVHDAPVTSQAPADGGDRDGSRRAAGQRTSRSPRRPDAVPHATPSPVVPVPEPSLQEAPQVEVPHLEAPQEPAAPEPAAPESAVPESVSAVPDAEG